MLSVHLDLLIAPLWNELNTLYRFVADKLRFNELQIAFVLSISCIILHHALIFVYSLLCVKMCFVKWRQPVSL